MKNFQKFELNRDLQRISLKMMYNMSMLRYRFSNERWGGGGGGGMNHLPLLFRKIVYHIKRHLKMINALHERKTYQPLTLLWLGTPSRTMDQLAIRNRTDINSQLTNIN